MEWVDEYAWLAAARDYPSNELVTRAMDSIDFKYGIPNGSILRFSIGKEKEEYLDVDGYLSRMETMERNGGAFARFVDDYKQVVNEEQERKFSFYTESRRCGR